MALALLALLPLDFGCGVSPAPVAAGSAGEGGLTESGATAEQLLSTALERVGAGDHRAAADALQEFVATFGREAAARPALAKALPLLAGCQMQLGRHEEAGETIRQALALGPAVEGHTIEKLRFWEGLCATASGDGGRAVPLLEAFVRDWPGSAFAPEARLLLASALVAQDRPREAADILAACGQSMPAHLAPRAEIMEIEALLGSGQTEAAAARFVRAAGDPAAAANPAALALAGLRLGDAILEAGRDAPALSAPLNAARCLRGIPRFERLVALQEAAVARLREAAAAEADPARAQSGQRLVAELERDLERLRRFGGFDRALLLRFASALQRAERHHEAALAFRHALDALPRDPALAPAGVEIVRCWLDAGRPVEAVGAARDFRSRFPDADASHEVAFLEADALRQAGQTPEAAPAFGAFADAQPRHPLAARARFLEGFCLLLLERFGDAVETFRKAGAAGTDAAVADAAAYWAGEALAMDGRFDEARAALARYAKDFRPAGAHLADAAFRAAYCSHALAEHARGARELRAFLADHPDHPRAGEARLLLGEALLADGRLDAGIEALRGVPTDDARHWEAAHFKIGRALRLKEDTAALLAHMEAFVRARPNSPRIPEAVHWIAWVHRARGDLEAARAVVWRTIETLGDSPAAPSVEDLLAGLARLYPGAVERAALGARLAALRREAETGGRPLFAARVLWAEGRLAAGTNPTRALMCAQLAASQVPTDLAGPRLLADLADTLREQGQTRDAGRLYEALLRNHPDSPRRDRAYAGLGLIAHAEGREDEALEWFDRFRRHEAGAPSAGEARVAHARILARRGRAEEAVALLDAALSDPAAPREAKARALVERGEIEMSRRNPAKAIPYYQRVYVVYGRWPELVSRAYLRSAEAFEQIGDTNAAVNTYREILARADRLPPATAERAREGLARISPPS